MQKDTRDLLTQLRKVSDPVLIGKMPEAELASTSAAIWDLEKKVTRSYMNVVSDRVQKLSTELKTPEERVVINQYVDLTKTFSSKLQSGIEGGIS